MKAIGGLLPLIIFLLIQVIVVAGGDGRASLLDGAVANPAEVKAYWGVTLPNTPMPPAMIDILAPPQGDISKVNAEYKRATQDDEKAQGSETFPRKFGHKLLYKKGDDKKIGKIPFSYNQLPNKERGASISTAMNMPMFICQIKAMRDVFFFEDDLVTGSALTTRIPSTITNLDFLHQDTSKHLPFSSKNFTDIINMFGPASLTMADDIAWTLKQCDHAEMVHGEIVGCATSIESFVELVLSSLGTNNVRAFSSGAPNEGVASVNYTLASVNLLTNSQSVLVCHDMPYPYKVFYCHTAAPSRAYQLKLVSDVGLPSMDALAVCHLNTMT